MCCDGESGADDPDEAEYGEVEPAGLAVDAVAEDDEEGGEEEGWVDG